jgi:hypothetical protein
MGKMLVKYSVKTTEAGIVYASSLARAKELKKKFGGTIKKWKTPRMV